MNDFFAQYPFVAGLLAVPFLAVACRLGFALGRRQARHTEEKAAGLLGNVQTAILGLLALFLGFTFAMAVSRFDARKQLILDEANAIGTAYLRADLLRQPCRGEMKQKLCDYVMVREKFYLAGADRAKIDAASRRANQLQTQLWQMTVAATEAEPSRPGLNLVVQSINELIDLATKRLAALTNQVPGVIWFLLMFVATTALLITGYLHGLAGHRSAFPLLILPLLLGLTVAILYDLDHPRNGFIQAGQEALHALSVSLAANPNQL